MTLSLVALLFAFVERLRGVTPAITASQTRQIFTRLIRHPAEIAEVITQVLRRHEESRIDHWHAATGSYPPRWSQDDSA